MQGLFAEQGEHHGSNYSFYTVSRKVFSLELDD